MARNPNTRWPNEHTLYLAASGGGKSQALYQNPDVPKRGARVVMWDPTPDQPGLHFTSMAKFIRAYRAGIASGRGFRVGFSGNASLENYLLWCEVVWHSLDGRYRTYALVEELSAVSPHAGKAPDEAALLLNQGRKYGLVWHGTTQKPQEISKTYYTETERKWIGRQKGLDNQRKRAAEIGVTQEQIRALENLQFYYDDGTADAARLVQLKYKAVQGIRHG